MLNVFTSICNIYNDYKCKKIFMKNKENNPEMSDREISEMMYPRTECHTQIVNIEEFAKTCDVKEYYPNLCFSNSDYIDNSDYDLYEDINNERSESYLEEENNFEIERERCIDFE